MCRHLAAIGGPDFDGMTAADLLFDAPHSLCEQARFPKHQTTGRDNPDGWGVAWYPTDRTTRAHHHTSQHGPDHHRTTTPIWHDNAFPARAREIECRALIAAARLASPGLAITSAGNAPFVRGEWAFSLNGAIDGFRGHVGDELRAAISAARRTTLESDTDSEVLFALTLDRIEAGAEPAVALAAVMRFVTSVTTGRINLLLTDGAAVYATRWVNSLFTGGCVVASEPLDDTEDWLEVPDRSLVVLDGRGTEIGAL
jgi:glutamine amidotransferase